MQAASFHADLVELNLGGDGLQFVKFHLSSGKTLSRCLLDRVDLDSGEVVTHLPPATSLEEAKKFEYGGKLPVPPKSTWRRAEGVTMIPVPSTRDHLIAVIMKHLSSPEKLCIMENANAGRADPWLKRSSVNALFFGDEVYHLVVGPTLAPTIEAAVRKAQSLYTFVGVLTSLYEAEKLPGDRGELTLSSLQRLAERSEQIFVGAYDGEGYLLWRRRSGSEDPEE